MNTKQFPDEPNKTRKEFIVHKMEDYFLTAERMIESADTLFSSVQAGTVDKNKWFNTCYLSGYVIECYGKLLFSAFVGDSSNTLKKIYGHDLKSINKDIAELVALVQSVTKYSLDLKVECPNIISGYQKWHPEKRYCCDNGIWDSDNIARAFLDEAQKVMRIINEMKLDGVI